MKKPHVLWTFVGAGYDGVTMSTEPTIVSNEHYEFLQLSQHGRISERASKVVDDEEQSLRQFNAELLQKIGDYRKKNLELSASENELRTKLALQTKLNAEKERDLVMKYETQISDLKKALSEKSQKLDDANEDWSRRLARLTDESWAQGLENENLRRREDELQSKVSQFQVEMDRAQELERSQALAIETLTSEKERIAAELEEAEHRKVEMKATFDEQNIQLAKLVEATRERESQMATAYEALRLEYANIDRCYNESNQALIKLQAEMRERYKQHETELQELQTYLQTKAAQDSSLIRDENAKLREALSQRETRLDQDRASMQAWKDQLNHLDQYLKQFAEKLRKSKSELIRLTKSIEDEVKFSTQHPFTEYLEMAEQEIAAVQQQLTGVSSMSPLKAKLETRLQQATAHRDGIKGILEKSASQITEHSRTIQTLVKSLEYLT